MIQYVLYRDICISKICETTALNSSLDRSCRNWSYRHCRPVRSSWIDTSQILFLAKITSKKNETNVDFSFLAFIISQNHEPFQCLNCKRGCNKKNKDTGYMFD